MKHLEEVDGWLSPVAARATDLLLRYQTARELTGDLMEIGVYAGRYFLVLAQAAQSLERLLAVDIFESQDPKIPSEQGNRAVFEANLEKYAPWKNIHIMESDSTRLSQHDIRMELQTTELQPLRFVSIDGCHDEETVWLDLDLVAPLLMTGGVVALDDWSAEGNQQWPGVAAGEAKFQTLTRGEVLHHIGTIPNKLLLTNDLFWKVEYQRILRDFAQREEE